MALLNLSSWIERRAEAVGPYADHIVHSVKAYEAEITRLRAQLAKADALAEVAMTFRDYASDAADGILWFESEKDGAKALFQICKKQGKDDLARTDAALAAYREGSDT